MAYFVHRIRRTNGVWDKGIEIKETLDDAKQGFMLNSVHGLTVMIKILILSVLR